MSKEIFLNVVNAHIDGNIMGSNDIISVYLENSTMGESLKNFLNDKEVGKYNGESPVLNSKYYNDFLIAYNIGRIHAFERMKVIIESEKGSLER